MFAPLRRVCPCPVCVAGPARSQRDSPAPSGGPVTLAQAALPSSAQRLEALFTAELGAGWFAPAFLQQIPFDQIQPLIGQLRQTLGPLQRLEAVADGYRLTFAEGTVPAPIRLDDQGRSRP